MSGRSGTAALRSSRSLAAVVLGGSVLAVLGIALVVDFVPRPRAEASPSPAPPEATLIDVQRLAANGLLGQIGSQPFDSLREDVMAQARQALQREPRPGPLPEAVGDLREDGKAALALAVSSVLGGDARHGRGATLYLEAWAAEAVLEPACREVECDRAWRIARDLPAFAFAADIVRGSGAMPRGRADAFADWLVAILPATPPPDDLRGDADVLARVVVAAYRDDEAALDAVTAEWTARLGAISADGRLGPAALAESPVAATQESLTYRLMAARIAGDRGRDLLARTGSSGASIRTAVDRLAADWRDPAAWPGSSRPPAGPLWEVAYALWGDVRYLPLLAEHRASGGGDLVAFRWSTLLEAGVTTATAPSPGASAAPTSPPVVPTPTPGPTPSPEPSATPRPGPIVAAPKIEFLPGVVRSDRASVRLDWPTAERAESDRSALSYRLDLAIGDEGYRKFAEGRRRRAEATLAPGTRYRFRLRASTVAAGAGPWRGLDLMVRRYEERHRAMATSGAWASASAPSYSGGRARYSTDRGATLTLDFHGRAVAVRGPIGPTRGKVDVILDGEMVGRIDLGADDFVGSVVVFERSWPTDGDHRIRLRVVGTPGRPVVAVDAIDVLDGGG
jgi:hypothetical protein